MLSNTLLALTSILFHNVVAQDGFVLSLFDKTLYPSAVCLDGTTAGYYKRPGSGAQASTYIIELEGGGWCQDLTACVARSSTDIGSSKSWPPTGCPGMDGGSNGLFSNNCAVNANFCNASMFHLNYCDGASFSGSVEEPVIVNGTELYFRGRAILDAALSSLLTTEGMASATSVILKGCSAGGLATILHLDYVAEVLKTRAPNAVVVGLPDAGYFLNHNTTTNQPSWSPLYQNVYSMQNVSANVDASCIAYYAQNAPSESWRCFMAQYTSPFLSTPAFFAQDLDDSWQMQNIYLLPCSPYAGKGNCNAAQMELVYAYRNDTLTALAPVFNDPIMGGFFTDCVQHCHSNINFCFDSEMVEGQSMQDTFFAWYQQTVHGITPTLKTKVVDGNVGTNPTCTSSCSPY